MQSEVLLPRCCPPQTRLFCVAETCLDQTTYRLGTREEDVHDKDAPIQAGCLER